MRKKIIIDLANSDYPNDRDLINENGDYFIIRLEDIEIRHLFGSGYFLEVSEKFDLYFIDDYEHETICEPEKLKGMKEVALQYAKTNLAFEYLYQSIVKSLDIAITNRSCFSIIL